MSALIGSAMPLRCLPLQGRRGDGRTTAGVRCGRMPTDHEDNEDTMKVRALICDLSEATTPIKYQLR